MQLSQVCNNGEETQGHTKLKFILGVHTLRGIKQTNDEGLVDVESSLKHHE
jgi:hypothetical protein